MVCSRVLCMIFPILIASLSGENVSLPPRIQQCSFYHTSHLPVEKSIRRQYERELSREEKKNIEYIISTLGSSSLIGLAKERSELKRRGKEIEQVHPFRLLEYTFKQEKLRVALENIKNRTFVRKEFFNGLNNSLEEEMQKDNLLNYLQAFCSELSIDYKSAYPFVKAKKWTEFINFLIAHKPRQGNFERYNM